MPKKRGKSIACAQRAKPYRHERKDGLVDRLVAKHGSDGQAILPILQEVAASRQSLSAESLGATADATQVHDAQVAGVASFYSMLPLETKLGTSIQICDGPVCMLNGASKAKAAVESAVQDDVRWCVGRSSCLGLCDRAPAALVGNEPCGPLSDYHIGTMLHGWRGQSPNYREPIVGEQRVAMSRIAKIEPESFASAVRAGAYQVLEEAVAKATENVLREIENSGLRGCGGAGFPTGAKWRMVSEADSPEKYIICNADESEPGAFKDRVLMENDPHLVLEGMALAAYAVGATKGIIYVRGEYERCSQMLDRAIRQAEQHGCLGKQINGSSFSFRVQVHRGAGAYICGEETALLESLEGRRGEPRLRPPYPTTDGYLKRPTVVNNVETLCMVPAIIQHGAPWYRTFGPDDAPGTKIFTLSGHVRRAAAFESPLRITVRNILNRIGLGMRSGSHFKMALTGGAAGTLIPAALLDVPIDFESIHQGVSLGSGVVIICDTSISAVDLLEWLLNFFRHESCGKCTPCREGTYVAHRIVKRIARGEGRAGDLAELRRLANMLHTTSFCGLGQSIALPVHSALNHFAKDFHRCGAT
jgi:NADH:ubiquinone oxidoreductase subunit F (NADH-binding)/NADH:ubiquinone oxidoreductase subunit E